MIAVIRLNKYDVAVKISSLWGTDLACSSEQLKLPRRKGFSFSSIVPSPVGPDPIQIGRTNSKYDQCLLASLILREGLHSIFVRRIQCLNSMPFRYPTPSNHAFWLPMTPGLHRWAGDSKCHSATVIHSSLCPCFAREDSMTSRVCTSVYRLGRDDFHSVFLMFLPT